VGQVGRTGGESADRLDQCARGQGVAIDPANLHTSFSALEAQMEAANVSMDYYGVIVSPGTRKVLLRRRSSRTDQSRPGQRSATRKARRKSPTQKRSPGAGTI